MWYTTFTSQEHSVNVLHYHIKVKVSINFTWLTCLKHNHVSWVRNCHSLSTLDGLTHHDGIVGKFGSRDGEKRKDIVLPLKKVVLVVGTTITRWILDGSYTVSIVDDPVWGITWSCTTPEDAKHFWWCNGDIFRSVYEIWKYSRTFFS